jgi:hypothetical protein
MTATIRLGNTKPGHYAFGGFTVLVSVTLPSTPKSIGDCAFGYCSALVTIAIPKQCRVSDSAFKGSKTRVTAL